MSTPEYWTSEEVESAAAYVREVAGLTTDDENSQIELTAYSLLTKYGQIATSATGLAVELAASPQSPEMARISAQALDIAATLGQLIGSDKLAELREHEKQELSDQALKNTRRYREVSLRNYWKGIEIEEPEKTTALIRSWLKLSLRIFKGRVLTTTDFAKIIFPADLIHRYVLNDRQVRILNTLRNSQFLDELRTEEGLVLYTGVRNGKEKLFSAADQQDESVDIPSLKMVEDEQLRALAIWLRQNHLAQNDSESNDEHAGEEPTFPTPPGTERTYAQRKSTEFFLDETAPNPEFRFGMYVDWAVEMVIAFQDRALSRAAFAKVLYGEQLSDVTNYVISNRAHAQLASFQKSPLFHRYLAEAGITFHKHTSKKKRAPRGAAAIYYGSGTSEQNTAVVPDKSSAPTDEELRDLAIRLRVRELTDTPAPHPRGAALKTEAQKQVEAAWREKEHQSRVQRAIADRAMQKWYKAQEPPSPDKIKTEISRWQADERQHDSTQEFRAEPHVNLAGDYRWSTDEFEGGVENLEWQLMAGVLLLDKKLQFSETQIKVLAAIANGITVEQAAAALRMPDDKVTGLMLSGYERMRANFAAER